MELGKQIREYRKRLNLSQDELAEKIFVSRQSISNWENDKTYPDIHSLLLLSSLFQVSLDNLVKGDLSEMKAQIQQDDIRRFHRDSNIFAGLLILSILSAYPLVHYLRLSGLIIWAGIYAVTMFFAFRIEKQKKAYNIQTYREIVAFTEGKRLDEIQTAREAGKRPYQMVLATLSVAAITGLVVLLMILFLP